MKICSCFYIFLFFILQQSIAYCQKGDTAIIAKGSIKQKNIIKDSAKGKDTVLHAAKKHDPTKATLYSAVCPGLGQIYNKKYWKLPLVYVAVGLPVYYFFNNRSWFNKSRYALAVVANGSYNNPDSLAKVDPLLMPFVRELNANGLIQIRNQFRQWEDYSVLFFLLFYALQIVDATVDAHLKDFNVSNDLSFHFKPNVNAGVGGTGIGLVFDVHKTKAKPVFDTR